MVAWETARLEDLCDLLTCGVAATPKYVDESIGVPFLSAQNVKNGKVTLHKFRHISQEQHTHLTKKNIPQKGDILYSRVGAGFGDAAVVEHTFDFSVYVSLTLIKPKPDKLYNYYLKYYLNSPQIKSLAISSITSSGVPNLNVKSVRNFPINFPELPEQKRIVVLLDTVFADLEQTRAKTEQNLKNARELFDSYLQQVFSQKGEGWEELPLENLVSEDCSLSYGIVQPGDDFNDGLPVVRPTDLKVELITQDGLKLIDPVKSESYKKTVLQGGELLVCVRGSTGITSIASNSLAGANVTRGIVPVRFNPELISGRFGYYQFISPLVQSQIKDATYGAALMQINIRDFRKIKISTPSIDVQKSLVNKLDSIRPDLIRAEEIYKQKLSALDELKKSILQKAFSGELTATAEESTIFPHSFPRSAW